MNTVGMWSLRLLKHLLCCYVVHSCIAGPLQSVVNAQLNSAIANLKYINDLGINTDGSLKMTSFKYRTADENGDLIARTLAVPLLILLPIPNVEVFMHLWRFVTTH